MLALGGCGGPTEAIATKDSPGPDAAHADAAEHAPSDAADRTPSDASDHAPSDAADRAPSDGGAPTIRIAAFNTSLNRPHAGQLATELAAGDNAQIEDVVRIVQTVAPDVVLLSEVDEASSAAQAIAARFGDRFAHVFAPEVNTGQPSGVDLDGDGTVGGPGDAKGYGAFPGQYGLLLLSRFAVTAHRCWGELLWRDVPDATLPDGYYSDDALAALPLSSKNHCDVTLDVDGHPLHVLIAHPTPPVFDGPEDRNGLRNAAEIALWADLLDGAAYLGAPLPAEARFVILGDLNADPHDGEARRDAIGRLIAHPRIAAAPVPHSEGAVAAATRDAGPNAHHKGPAAHDTSDFPEARGPGNLRVDYVLPSKTLTIIDAGVFWPAPDQPLADAVACSDHRLVWVDVSL